MDMGFQNRKKSGNKFAGSRTIVPGQGVYTVKPGGNNKINQQGPKDPKKPR